MSKGKEIAQRKNYTVNQILDYMDCSLCYHLKYTKGVLAPADFLANNQNVAYQEAVLETIRFYYLEHQNGRPPELKTLYDKYLTLWQEKTGTVSSGSILTRELKDSTKMAREKNSKYIGKGYEAIQKFYNQNATIRQAVLAVQHPYDIEMKQLSVTGTFDLVREVMNEKKREREIELVSFQLGIRKPDESKLKHDLNLSAMAFGFEQAFETRPDRFILSYINRNENIQIYRGLDEYKRMFAVLDGFQQSVDTITPYPRPGAHKIASPYKELCDNYTY